MLKAPQLECPGPPGSYKQLLSQEGKRKERTDLANIVEEKQQNFIMILVVV